MAKKINFQITTPERIVFSDQIDEVVLPTAEGEIGILPNHIPLVSLLVPGEIKIKRGTAEEFMAVSGGFIEVRPDKVVVLADTAEREEEIDEIRAEEARKKAQSIMHEKRIDAKEFASLTAKIEKELARLKVVNRRRRKTRASLR
ncbi:F0F1 ATP synthase subunit epsilon [Patescibacteria group bacterium]|nr:F0F1 ATP synthase subunit epsilon [Patescibacteria group bacterium]MBU0963922.1 F0F1 ATP synthase subunit epsilon [Patescibacteria group bacterium]